jgi:hypothetical protein
MLPKITTINSGQNIKNYQKALENSFFFFFASFVKTNSGRKSTPKEEKGVQELLIKMPFSLKAVPSQLQVG